MKKIVGGCLHQLRSLRLSRLSPEHIFDHRDSRCV